MILIYTDKLNSRLEYIAHVLFTSILQQEITFTSDPAVFADADLPKLNYSARRFEHAINITPHTLLFNRELAIPESEPVMVENQHLFFKSPGNSNLPSDPLAASFYLITRYEEYLNNHRDAHGRFPAECSILTKFNLLRKPVVNIWARILGEKMAKQFAGFYLPEPRFTFIPTIDIDNAWAYAHKGFWRSAGALARAAITHPGTDVKERIEVLLRKKRDPFDTYRLLNECFEGREEQVRFFFLLGDYSRYDKNISWKNHHLQQLIRETDQRYRVGIHPSYSASQSKESHLISDERRRLEKITGKKITRSRFHYLKLHIPESYRHLIKAGISEDYSMGYPSHTGFRAGICTPYFFYDLHREATTSLKIIPFQVMDVTLKDYLKLTPEEAMTEIGELMAEVRKCGGIFSAIWHNESLTGRGAWKGYDDLFRKMIEMGFDQRYE